METVLINLDSCKENEISIEEALLLLVYGSGRPFTEIRDSLMSKSLITAFYNNRNNGENKRATAKGVGLMAKVLHDSHFEKKQVGYKEEEIQEIASAIKELYPKGKKSGTSYYWSDGVAIISRRLKLFFKKYGTKYTKDQIMDATKRYVASFNGDYSYMRLLKYFIFKEKIGAANEVEGDSLLLNFIENEHEDNLITQDWTSELN